MTTGEPVDDDDDGVAAAEAVATTVADAGVASVAVFVTVLSESTAAANCASSGVGVLVLLLLLASGLTVTASFVVESTWNEAGRKKLLGTVAVAVSVAVAVDVAVPAAEALDSSVDGRSMLDLMAATMGCELELLELLARDSLVLLSSTVETSRSSFAR